MAIQHRHHTDSPRQHIPVLAFPTCSNFSLFTPRVYHPVDRSEPLAAPEQTCTPISYYFTFFYVDHLVRKGIFQELGLDDLPPLPDTFRAKIWRKKWIDSQYTKILWRLIFITKSHIAWSFPSTCSPLPLLQIPRPNATLVSLY